MEGPSVEYYLFCLGSQVCVFHSWEEWAGLGQMEDYLSVLEYLLWVFTPLAVVFILPFLIVILLYLSILFLHVYKVNKCYKNCTDHVMSEWWLDPVMGNKECC